MFEWDENKNQINRQKHGVSFRQARKAFFDPKRLIIEDTAHSADEQRFFCLGDVDGGIMTVRFTFRDDVIRIFGAGYWKKRKQRHEKENQIY